MIRVRLELLPGGFEGDPEFLGEILITNDIFRTLESVGKRGDYAANIYKKRRGKKFMRVKVKDYPRLSYHPWELVYRILHKAREMNGGPL